MVHVINLPTMLSIIVSNTICLRVLSENIFMLCQTLLIFYFTPLTRKWTGIIIKFELGPSQKHFISFQNFNYPLWGKCSWRKLCSARSGGFVKKQYIGALTVSSSWKNGSNFDIVGKSKDGVFVYCLMGRSKLTSMYRIYRNMVDCQDGQRTGVLSYSLLGYRRDILQFCGRRGLFRRGGLAERCS